VDGGLVAHQVEGGDFFVAVKRPLGALDDDTAAVVAAHDIHRNSHTRMMNAQTCLALSAGAEFNSIERSGSGCNCQHLTPFVIATRGTHAVRHIRRVTLGALAQLRKLQNAVVGAAHALAAVGRFSLGNTHKSN
jgi:hypothetical protein